jgi:hypothetical protein
VPVGEFPLTVALQMATEPITVGETLHKMVVGSCITIAKGVLEEASFADVAMKFASWIMVVVQMTLLPDISDAVGGRMLPTLAGLFLLIANIWVVIRLQLGPATSIGSSTSTVRLTSPATLLETTSAWSKQEATTPRPDLTIETDPKAG